MIIRDVNGYRTVGDYQALWRLAHKTSVICLVYYQGDRDVAHTKAFDGMVAISARGICYVSASYMGQFVDRCREASVEWIRPNKEASSE